MDRVLRALCLVVSCTTAFTACGGRDESTVTPATNTRSAAASTVTGFVRSHTTADAEASSFVVTTSGGATCGDAGLTIACQGPAGSSATLAFSVPKGPLGYPPVSCGPVSWSTRKLLSSTRSPHTTARQTSALGDAYYCGTASGSVTAVAPAAYGYSNAEEASGQFEVCFALPINPCAQTGVAGGTVLITNSVLGSGAPTPAPTPVPPGNGGGDCSSAAARPVLATVRRPATGVVGGGGSPTPVPAGSPIPTPSPGPSLAPPCATPTPLPDANTIELLTSAYPDGAPQYVYETSYDGSETGVVGTASRDRQPSGHRAVAQAAYGCVGRNTADGRVDGHISLSSMVQCVGNISLSSVTYFVFDKDPNVPNSYRTFSKFVLPCDGGATCRTGRVDYVVSHTQVAKIVTYFDDNYGRSTNGELTLPYNEKGVLYPIVYPYGYGGALAQEVPWPAPQFFPCSRNLPANLNCADTTTGFRRSVIALYKANRWPLTENDAGNVPNSWQAHHIKPVSWGGDNSPTNGVMLLQADHRAFTNWWNDFVQDGVRVPVRQQNGD